MPDALPGIVCAERDFFGYDFAVQGKGNFEEKNERSPLMPDLSSRMVLAVIFCSSRF